MLNNYLEFGRILSEISFADFLFYPEDGGSTPPRKVGKLLPCHITEDNIPHSHNCMRIRSQIVKKDCVRWSYGTLRFKTRDLESSYCPETLLFSGIQRRGIR
jgi:hypothetical protein